MAKNAPGKHFRTGLSLVQAVEQFADPVFTENWFIGQRWPNGAECPVCNSKDLQHRANRKPQPFRCNGCRYDFSVKTDTVMHSSKLPLKAWGLALYTLVTNLKGVSSMKLHRDLGVTQKTAWHLAHRIRTAWKHDNEPFTGPVEKKLRAGRGIVGKVAVVGMKDRETGHIESQVVESTDAGTLQSFVRQYTQRDAMVYTDEHGAYRGLPRRHEAVRHSVSEFVRGMAHTNGMESHWASLKRGYEGVYHHMSEKHLDRYVVEFEGRHNDRPSDTINQMGLLVRGAEGKRLRYADLIGPKETRNPRML